MSGSLTQDQRFEGKYSRGVYEALRFSFRPYWLQIMGLMGVCFLGRMAFLAVAWLIGIWADTLCREGSCGARQLSPFWTSWTTSDFLWGISCLTALSFLFNIGYRVPFTRIGALGVSRLYDEITLRTSRLPQSFFDRTPVGRIVSRFSGDYGAVLRMAGGPLGEFLVIVVDLILISFFIGATHLSFFPIVLLTLLVNLAVFRLNRRSLRDSRREVSRSRGPGIAHFAETSQGAESIRVFGKQRTFRRRFLMLAHSYFTSRVKSVGVIQGFSTQMTLTTGLLLLSTAGAGYALAIHGLMSIGQLAGAFTYVVLLSSTTQQFFDYLGRFDEALTGIERLQEYMDVPLEEGMDLPGVSGRVAHSSSTRDDQQSLGRVEIRDLSLRYAPQGPRVLDAVSLDIEPGEKMGVIGRTGSGKSSFLNALFCLYPFESGTVRVNGFAPEHCSGARDPSLQVPLGVFRQQMSLIAQEPVLFRGSLRENLLVVGRDVGDAEMLHVLESVGLGSWCRPQEGGLDREVAEQGGNLSAGQRQLVCVARALLEDRPVIVMDEATSAVDPRTEERMISIAAETLAGKTQIIVAHRLSTLRFCDRILWLDQGRVRMLGSAKEVMAAFQQTAADNAL